MLLKMAGGLDIRIVLFTLLCASVSLVSAQPMIRPKPRYLLVVPKVLISGSSEVACITLYNMGGPINFNLNLTIDGEVVRNYEYFMEFPYACIDLSVPEIESPSAEAEIILEGQYKRFVDLEGQYDLGFFVREYIRDTKQVTIKRPKLETFIETDKPIYKPGQTVKFRILTLDENLRTDTSQVEKIWVETPSGVHIAQWLFVEGEQGLINLELPMTSDPMLGKWKIFVVHHGVKSEASFKVEEYVLPKFEVTIDGPSYLLVNETSVQYTICGRYTYGQPVIASVRAELFLTNAGWSVRSLASLVESTGPSGCAEVTFENLSWGRLHRFYWNYWDGVKLRLSADLTETVTGVELHKEDSRCKLTNEVYNVAFASGNQFKSGVPYYGKVRVTTPDGAPAANIPVHIEMTRGGEFRTDVVTDSSGVATFEAELSYSGQYYVNMMASVPGMPMRTPDSNSVNQLVATPAAIRLKPHYSPSGTSLKLSPVDGPLAIGSEATLRIAHNMDRTNLNRDFKAVFMSKGHLIQPEHAFSFNRSGSVGEGQGYETLELTFTVTRDMAPVTKLLVYFEQYTEVIADSIVFNVEMSLENQVDISFASATERPGDETRIDITAAPDSLCGVGVVDKSVYLLGGGQNTIQEKQLRQYLNRLQLGRDNEGCGPPGPDTAFSFWVPYHDDGFERDSSYEFHDVGLLYMTNLALETMTCPTYSQVLANSDIDPGLSGGTGGDQRDQQTRIRSYFPETWLWDLVPVNSNGHGHVNLTVPDTITEWVGSGFCISATRGIGISPTSRLQAFQPFFVSFTLPYSVIRGETLPAKVTLFNYMSECLVVALILADSENFTLAENEYRVKTVCVCGSQSASVDFNIIPNVIGMMPIKVSAQSVPGWCEDNFIDPLSEGGSDVVQREILVEAEGIKQEVTKSEFFCLSESDSSFSWSVSVEPPADIVPGTAWAKITLTGDIMGPTLSNLDRLVQVPWGCGEQNMVTFVPNVLAMQYLRATDQLTPDIAKRATDNMKLGYQRQFNYRHDDGSFSAFGKGDDSGSTWLTAYVVRSFYQASQFIVVDFEDLERSIDWLKSLQGPEGCFRSVGKVWSKDLMGGVNNNLTLSAYVVISLLEAGQNPQDLDIARGVQCLERGLTDTDDTYTLALIGYALALADSDQIGLAMQRLHSLGPVDDSHWVSNREGTSSLPSYYHASTADVEITSYALMAYMAFMVPAEVIAEGLPISKWLVQQRNGNGGFLSTQDTVVGLTALSRFAEYTSSDDMDVTLTVESSQSQSEWGRSQELEATNENRLLLQQLYMDNLPTTVDFEASGQGCGLLQVSWYYNLYPEAPEEPEFQLGVKIEDHPQNTDCSQFLVEVCASYTGADGASNMAVIDFRLQSGYTSDRESLDRLKATNPILKRYELDGKSVLFYFDEITGKAVCVEFTIVQDIKVKDTKPSFVTVYDYYKTDVKKIQQYSLECSTEPILQRPPRSWGGVANVEGFPGPDDPVDPQTTPVPFNPDPYYDERYICPPKSGRCDSIEEGFVCEDPREDACVADYQCPGERKCCHDGCAKTCAYPNLFIDRFSLRDPSVLRPVCREFEVCPICEDRQPDDSVNKFCYSSYALVAKYKGNNRFKVFYSKRHGRKSAFDFKVYATIDETCDCQLEPNRRYILLTNRENFNVESRELVINGTTLIYPFKGSYVRQMDPALCGEEVL